MSAVPFKLYRRPSKNGQTIYYARYRRPDGTYTAGRSTGEVDRRKAEAKAWEYVTGGRVAASQSATIADLADRRTDAITGMTTAHFFDWDGEHTLSKRSAGKRITNAQCRKNNALLEAHVVRLIGGVKWVELDSITVRRFRNTLFKEGFAGSTINKCLGVLKALIDQADETGLLRNPVRVERAAVRNKPRGVLTQEEVARLFDTPWDPNDLRGFAASMLAAATGLRLGEIQGLRIEDVEAGYVTVRGVWSDSTGMWKVGTKNGQPSRTVPIPPAVERVIADCIAQSPWTRTGKSWVFFSVTRDHRPTTDRVLTRRFYDALNVILKIGGDLRRERNLTFHSHRHFFNSLLVESRVPIEKIQRLTGHLSRSMVDHYYHEGEMDDVTAIQKRLFRVLPERRAG